MDKYLDAISVLPEELQDDVMDNFTPEYVAEVLSDYVLTLQNYIRELESDINCYVESQPPL